MKMNAQYQYKNYDNPKKRNTTILRNKINGDAREKITNKTQSLPTSQQNHNFIQQVEVHTD